MGVGISIVPVVGVGNSVGVGSGAGVGASVGCGVMAGETVSVGFGATGVAVLALEQLITKARTTPKSTNLTIEMNMVFPLAVAADGFVWDAYGYG